MKRKIILLIPLFILLFSCRKDNDVEDLTQTILLNDLTVTDHSIVLNWSKVQSKHFVQYTVARINQWKKFYGCSYEYDTVAIITDQNTLSFEDNNLAESPDLRYYIMAKIGNGTAPIYSNVQQYLSPKYKILETSPFDVIQNINKQTLYFFENGKGSIISTYDYANDTIISKIKMDSLIGYSYLYDDGLSRRLIVPSRENKLLLLNEDDLKVSDTINIGFDCNSLVANNSKIFTLTNDGAFSNRIYNINTHQLIKEIGGSSNDRLFLMPNSSTDLINVTIDITPPSIYKVNFSENDVYSSLGFSGYDDRPIDNLIFRIFPDGKYLITSNVGAIFSSDLTFISQLPIPDQYFKFSDFSINNDGNQIYAGGSGDKSIIEYTFPEMNISKIYHTIGFPFKIFLDNDYLIVISNRERTDIYYLFDIYNYNDANNNEFIVEKIKIK